MDHAALRCHREGLLEELYRACRKAEDSSLTRDGQRNAKWDVWNAVRTIVAHDEIHNDPRLNGMAHEPA